MGPSTEGYMAIWGGFFPGTLLGSSGPVLEEASGSKLTKSALEGTLEGI